jgi:uncharacterized iron-regulated protein
MHAGYSADLEIDHERAARRLRTTHYHLIIVSNTFTRDEQLSIRAKLRQVKPEVSVLLLTEREIDADQFLRSVESHLRPKHGTIITDVSAHSARRHTKH